MFNKPTLGSLFVEQKLELSQPATKLELFVQIHSSDFYKFDHLPMFIIFGKFCSNWALLVFPINIEAQK